MRGAQSLQRLRGGSHIFAGRRNGCGGGGILLLWRLKDPGMQMLIIKELKLVIMTVAAKTIKTEIQLPVDILYSLGIDKTRIEYFVKRNFLLELYREGRISLAKMAARSEERRVGKECRL